MALQIWLPLNGTTKNQGLLGELTVSSPTYVDGKLGKAINTGAIKMSAEQTAQVLNNDEVSIAFWVYVNAETGSTTNRAMLFGNESTDANNNRKFSLFQYPTCNDFHWSWMNDESLCTFENGVLIGALPSYKWTHVAVVYKNPTIKVFINGTLKHTATGKVSNSSSFAYDTQVIYNSQCHYFNDYRVYNNAISEKEVHKLSKGLVVHYPLNQPEKEINLCPNSFINETSSMYGFGTRRVQLSANHTYTLVVNGRVIDGDGHLETYIYKPDWTESVNRGTWSKTDATYSMQITPKTTGTYEINSYSFLKQQTAGGNVHVNWYKLTEGGYPVSGIWSPSPSDTDNWEGVEYDTSGLGNTGIPASGITYSMDSPRNDGCYRFSDTSNISTTLNTAGFANIYSISYWAKIDDFAYKMAFGFSDGNHLNLYPTTGKFCLNTGDMDSNPFTNASYEAYNDGKWHHYAITGDADSGIATLYIDGVKIGTAKFRVMNGTKLYISGWGYNDNYQWANGYISDFRLYATVLSDADIKELYNIPISITANGALITQGEIKEE